jgi:dephospho-CoA kinase
MHNTQKKKKPFVIGVTGGLLTGTTRASGYIARFLKARIIRADDTAHNCLKNDPLYIGKLIDCFGRGILDKKGVIDRKKLSKKAFATKAAHKKFCNIAYPVIIKSIKQEIKNSNLRSGKYIILDAPMLIESGFYRHCGCVIVITASLDARLKRSGIRGFSAKEALSRIALQMPLGKKADYADYIIDNSNSFHRLLCQCKDAVRQLKSKETGYGHRRGRT